MATQEDRAAGVVLAVLIGDALGCGSHWIYDEDEFRKLVGWQTDYIDPIEGKYHHPQLKAGQVTQSGELTARFARSIAENKGYDFDAFCDSWDEMLSKCDGTRTGGEHGWTNKDFLEVYRARMQNKPWGPETAGFTDTTDGIVRAAICAARYYNDIPKMVEVIKEQSRMQYKDIGLMSQAICFGCIVAEIIKGYPLDEKLGFHLYGEAMNGNLPFANLSGSRDDEEGLPEPDGLVLLSTIYNTANRIMPDIEAYKGSDIYGKFCAWFGVLPSSYFCASKHPKDFEAAMLAAINGGGQNVVRGSLTGALVAAEVGLSSIPQRWIDGLVNGDDYMQIAKSIAAAAGGK